MTSFRSALCLFALATPLLSEAQSAPSTPQTLSTAEVARRASPASVVVLALSANGDTLGQGSGFILRADGVIVTNHHVLAGSSRAAVILPNGETYTRVRVLDADSSLDLALLKIPGAGLPFLPPRTTTPRAGERAVVLGSPLGLANTVSEGIVSAARVVEGRELIQITAPISPGSSGGPVLDGTGRVFAVATAYLAEGQQLNFAVPVRYAVGLLEDGPTERSVAEVFAGSPATQSTQSRAATTMRRASQPRTEFGGTYSLTEQIRDSDGAVRMNRVGFLVANREVGLLSMAEGTWDKVVGETFVSGVTRWSSNSAGDLLLAAGGITWDGFQAEGGGFFAEGRFTFEKREFVSVISAEPYRLPLSSEDGLYRATVRTRYRARGREGSDYLEWTGDLAVAFANDSIYVDLALYNASGGSTAFFATGRLIAGERFDLSDSSGSRLTGSVRDGLLTADWTDQRENGAAFVGRLRADRR